MSSHSSITAPLTFRVKHEHLRALKNLPVGVSAHDVVRALLTEYLEGRLPQLHQLIIEESSRKTAAVRAGKKLSPPRTYLKFQQQQQQRKVGA